MIKFYNLNILHPEFKTNDNLFAGLVIKSDTFSRKNV